jgi:hypothetical protein
VTIRGALLTTTPHLDLDRQKVVLDEASGLGLLDMSFARDTLSLLASGVWRWVTFWERSQLVR